MSTNEAGQEDSSMQDIEDHPTEEADVAASGKEEGEEDDESEEEEELEIVLDGSSGPAK